MEIQKFMVHRKKVVEVLKNQDSQCLVQDRKGSKYWVLKSDLNPTWSSNVVGFIKDMGFTEEESKVLFQIVVQLLTVMLGVFVGTILAYFIIY
jgi:hypothetical protein